MSSAKTEQKSSGKAYNWENIPSEVVRWNQPQGLQVERYDDGDERMPSRHEAKSAQPHI